MAHRSAGEATLVAALLALLAAAIVYPLLQVLSVAFLDGGVPTLRPLGAFFARPLFREAFVNTLLAGVLAVVIGSVSAVPLALPPCSTVPGVPWNGTGVPLRDPALRGRGGFHRSSDERGGNLLRSSRGLHDLMRLTGVLVQSLHYFPFILLTPRPRSPASTARSRGGPTSQSGSRPSVAAAAAALPARGGALLTFTA